MNLQHLRYFLAVMDAGSVSRAADLLGVTQPTLSLALKRLEAEFGTRLFAPEGRGIKPLPAARQLEVRVRQAVRTLSDARRDLAGLSSERLRLGLLPSLAAAWLPRLLSSGSDAFEIVETAPDEIDRQLKSGALDLGLSIAPTREGLARKILLRESYVLFAGATHPFAGRRSVRLAELGGQAYVLRQSCERLGSGRRLLQAAGVRLNVVAKATQESTAATLVAAGVGCTLAPASWHCPDAQRIDVDGLDLERTVVLAWSKGNPQSKAIADVSRRLVGTAQNLRDRAP